MMAEPCRSFPDAAAVMWLAGLWLLLAGVLFVGVIRNRCRHAWIKWETNRQCSKCGKND